MDHDVFRWEVRLNATLRNIRESKELSERNKEILLKFYGFCVRQEITKGRTARDLYDLMRIALKWLKKDFDQATKEDIENVVTQINQQVSQKGKPLTDPTKQNLKGAIKKLVWWMKGAAVQNGKRVYPPEVSWISLRIKTNNNKLPEDILTEAEVNMLVEAAKDSRERSFIAVLYESGCRTGEILNLKVKNVEFDEYGALLTVTGKTGPRRIRIVSSVPFLKEWLRDHPKGSNRESFVFLNRDMTPMNWKVAWRVLRSLKQRSGVKKRVNLHNFRHSRATHLANVLTDAQMRIHFGWVKASRMTEVYEHLSGGDVDKRLLEYYGVEKRPNVCNQCKETNRAGSRYCQKCGMPLAKEVATKIVEKDVVRKEADNILDTLLQDEEFKKIFVSKVKRMIR